MAFSDTYHRQAALLVRLLPFVAEETCFALKGGTAINLFIRDLPRLSVDIDLTYLPIAPRSESLADIDAAMKRIASRVRTVSPAYEITEQPLSGEEAVTKLFARSEGVQIKIEVTPVLRGSLYEPQVQTVSPAVEDAFGFAQMQVLSFADLYGGKIVAALDRQHPRDLFDIRDLLANEGINEDLRRAFLVYLLSHGRPMHEVLSGRPKDITGEYERAFAGMTEIPVALDELLQTRDILIQEMVGNMPPSHRHFLIGFERGEPDWDSLGFSDVAQLPAVRWRQRNLDKLNAGAREALVHNLAQVLDV